MARATKARSINRSTKRGQLTAPPRTADAFFYTLFTDIGGGLQFKCVTHPLKCVCNARCLHHGTYISVPVPLHCQQIEGMVWKEWSHALPIRLQCSCLGCMHLPLFAQSVSAHWNCNPCCLTLLPFAQKAHECSHFTVHSVLLLPQSSSC